MPLRGVFETEAIRNGIPRDIGLDDCEAKRKKIHELRNNELSPFHKRDMKDVFVYALAIAQDTGARPEKLGSRSGSIPFSSFSDEQSVLMLSLAIAYEGNIDFLREETKVRKAVSHLEEMANRGIDILYDRVFGPEPGNPDRKLERRLFEISEDL